MRAAVELKDFVRQTLLDIAAGLHEANETYKASQISACGTPGSASTASLRVMLQTRWSAEAWLVVRVELRRALALRSEIRRAGWFN
jgi:hypothetical protein